MNHASDFLTTTDAARIAGVAANTIRLWERLGKIPAQRTASGVRLFRLEDVQRVAAQRAEQPSVA